MSQIDDLMKAIRELSRPEWDELDDTGRQAYATYRKRGLDTKAAHKAALAYQRNYAEQRKRRLDHMTGAE